MSEWLAFDFRLEQKIGAMTEAAFIDSYVVSRCFFPESRSAWHDLQREFGATHDPEIREEIYKLGRELEKMEKLEKQSRAGLRSGPLFWSLTPFRYRLCSSHCHVSDTIRKLSLILF